MKSEIYAEDGAKPNGNTAPGPGAGGGLERGLGLGAATALNVTNMVGIGPFITIPLFLAAMGGPQALVAWVLAAVLVLCDGLVWSELGAALPGSGGTYHFLREIFGGGVWGRLLPFLFIWQFLVSGTLEIASGYIGTVDYIRYIFPGLDGLVTVGGRGFGAPVLAACGCALVTLLLCRRIAVVGRWGIVFLAGTLVTVFTVIGCGLAHFDGALLAMAPGAFHLDWRFAFGLGAAMRIAVYDYLGYYNICHLGEEVRDPGRTIPRAVIFSVVLVAAIYLTMNLCIIAVVPWQEAMRSTNVAALFMERLFGRGAAVAFTWMIVWTSIGCLFSITLGYSRIPYAAARAGDFFRVFARLHPSGHYPAVTLPVMGILIALFCFVPLDAVIAGAVTVRILVQFIAQIAALHVLRTRRAGVAMPFRMWFYPLPSIVALGGWIFLWGTSGARLLAVGLGVLVSGAIVYAAREAWGRRLSL